MYGNNVLVPSLLALSGSSYCCWLHKVCKSDLRTTLAFSSPVSLLHKWFISIWLVSFFLWISPSPWETPLRSIDCYESLSYAVFHRRFGWKLGFSGSFAETRGSEKTPLADMLCLSRPGPVTGVGVKCPELGKNSPVSIHYKHDLCVWRMVCCFLLTPPSLLHHSISFHIPHYLFFSRTSIECDQSCVWLRCLWNTDTVVL